MLKYSYRSIEQPHWLSRDVRNQELLHAIWPLYHTGFFGGIPVQKYSGVAIVASNEQAMGDLQCTA